MTGLSYFTSLKVNTEAVKIVSFIYQKLADILLFYQNHKKVVTLESWKSWKCLQYVDLISDVSLVLPRNLLMRSNFCDVAKEFEVSRFTENIKI